MHRHDKLKLYTFNCVLFLWKVQSSKFEKEISSDVIVVEGVARLENPVESPNTYITYRGFHGIDRERVIVRRQDIYWT